MKHGMTKRLCALFLLTAMLASCGNGGNAETTSDNGTESITEAASTTENEETEAAYPAEVKKYDGYTFTILNQEDDFWTGSNHILDYEELTGDGLSDAVYNRNRDAEATLDIKLEIIKGSLGQTNDMRAMMNKAVAAMEDIYDVVYIPLNYSGATSFDGKSTLNLHTVKSLLLDREWWSQSFIKEATIGDNLLYTTIDYVNLMGYAYSNGLIFNRGMYEKYGMETPYEFVRAGKWTYDRMNEAIANVVSMGTQTDWKPDLGGDAIYGLVGQHAEATVTLLQASGERLIVKDDKNMPVLNTAIDRAMDAYDRLMQIFSLEGNCMLINKPECQGFMFLLEDRGLFYIGALGSTSSSTYRESDAEYGILPVPKYMEEQTDYNTMVSQYTFALNIPLTAGDPERTGAIMDYLAYQSYSNVIPVLQTNMCYKGVSDPNDIEMMDVLLSTQTLDIGQLYGWTADFLNTACGESKMLKGVNTFVSDWAKRTDQIESKIEKQFTEE